MKQASKQEAHANPQAHVFVAGVGYLEPSAPLPVPAHPNGGKNCLPPNLVIAESEHLLRKPGCEETERFFWRAQDRTWRPERFWFSTRLSFSPEHLSKAGWEYVGPAPARDRSPVEDPTPSVENADAPSDKVKPAKPKRKGG